LALDNSNWFNKLVYRRCPMNDHIHTVGAFEAKTHLSELLRRTENGEEFVIERRGRPVARLVPYVAEQEEPEFSELVGRMQRVRSEIDGTVSVVEMIREGRRR
jgi:prevent-host-death family protein